MEYWPVVPGLVTAAVSVLVGVASLVLKHRPHAALVSTLACGTAVGGVVATFVGVVIVELLK